MNTGKVVIPAKAGIHSSANSQSNKWVPAFAGMTVLGLAGEGSHP
jgi:hypothetical protein